MQFGSMHYTDVSSPILSYIMNQLYMSHALTQGDLTQYKNSVAL